MALDDETLTQLAKEEWKARRKTVKHREYIIIRKDGKDRSLGPFNDELWGNLASLGMVKARPSDELNDLKESMARVNMEIAELRNRIEKEKTCPELESPVEVDVVSKLLEWKASNCPFAKNWRGNRFCSLHYFNDYPQIFAEKYFPNVTLRRSAMGFDGKNQKWRFTPHPEICGLCNPLDKSLKIITTKDVFDIDEDGNLWPLNEMIENLHSDLLDDIKLLWDMYRNLPTTDLYDNFKCSNCESTHLIAVKIRCTKCNLEYWWGRHPKQ